MAIIFLVGTTPSSNTFDYPVSLISSARIMHGEKPYVDFDPGVYGPLHYYITTMGLWTLSFLPLVPSFNLLYVIWTSIYVLVIIWFLSKPIEKNPLFLLLYIYIIALLPLITQYAFYSLPSGLMLAIAVLRSRNFFTPDPKDISLWITPSILASIIVGSLLSRMNFGIYIIFSLTLVSILNIPTLGRKILSRLTLLFMAILALGIIAVVILYCSGILSPYVQDMIRFMPRYKSRLQPVLWGTTPPQLILVIALLLTIAATAIDLIRQKHFGAGLFGTILLGCLFQYAFGRLDVEHLYPAFLLFPFVYLVVHNDYQKIISRPSPSGHHPNSSAKSPLSIWIQRIWLVLLLLVPLFYSSRLLGIIETTSNYWNYNWTNDRSFMDDTVLILPGEINMLKELAAEKESNSEIFWGSMPGSCESTTQIGANVGLYLVQGRLPTTRIWYFDTCTTAYPDVQQILVEDLEARQIKRIAMQGYIDPSIGYLPGNPPESRIFFDYVRSKYTLRKHYAMPEANRYYDIYVRNGLPWQSN
jgi:hypothetical protein